MNIDQGLLGAVLREGVSVFFDEGLKPEMLEAESRPVYQFIFDHWKEHQKLPDAEVVLREHGVDLRAGPREPLKFWAKEIHNRHLYEKMRDTLGPAIKLMEARDPMGALAELEGSILKLRSESPRAGGRPASIFARADDLIEAYERAKKEGITGVPTPWATLNHITRGWQEEEFIIFAARPGSGKTWLLLIMALWAKQEGKKVLVGSTEMSGLSLSRRAAALATKVSYGKIRHGNLDSMTEERFKNELRALKDDTGLMVMGDGFKVTIESIEAAIVEHKPALVCIDGFYLLKSPAIKARDRLSRIAEVVELLKEVAKRTKTPIIGTTQMNRAPKEGTGQKKADLDRLAFSDNMGMIADYVFFLNQNKDMRENKEMEIQPVKTRESDYMEAFKIKWDFEAQDFTQKSDAPKASGQEIVTQAAKVTPEEKQQTWQSWHDPDSFRDVPEDEPF